MTSSNNNPVNNQPPLEHMSTSLPTGKSLPYTNAGAHHGNQSHIIGPSKQGFPLYRVEGDRALFFSCPIGVFGGVFVWVLSILSPFLLSLLGYMALSVRVQVSFYLLGPILTYLRLTPTTRCLLADQ